MQILHIAYSLNWKMENNIPSEQIQHLYLSCKNKHPPHPKIYEPGKSQKTTRYKRKIIFNVYNYKFDQIKHYLLMNEKFK